jgi:hypothetical protein
MPAGTFFDNILGASSRPDTLAFAALHCLPRDVVRPQVMLLPEVVLVSYLLELRELAGLHDECAHCAGFEHFLPDMQSDSLGCLRRAGIYSSGSILL